MTSKLAAVWAICSAICIPTYAYAAKPVPEQTSAFVAYCASHKHFDDCKNQVLDTDIATMMGIVIDKSSAQPCTVPKGVSTDDATKQILEWLGKHKDLDSMKTGAGIRTAEKDLWHCQAQVGDGREPGDPPAKTGDFVAYCATNYIGCANEMVIVAVAVGDFGMSEHCAPPDSMEGEDLYKAVLPWLKQHPETYGLNTDDGIMAAFNQIWPCH